MIKNILFAVVLAVLSLTTVNAQEETSIETQPQYQFKGSRVYYVKRESRINWMPAERETRRFTIALRPFYLINDGIKVDFELELPKPGQWLQFQAAYRGTGWYRGNYSEYDGWSNFESNHNCFSKLGGYGLGAAYKYMFTPNGWYFSAAVTFNYYSVHFPGYYLSGFEEDGMQFYEYEYGYKNNRYYNPAFSFNIGKHVAITRNLFIDGYIGLGYTRAIEGKGNDRHKYGDHGMFSWGYSGVTFNGGFRIGWLFRGSKL